MYFWDENNGIFFFEEDDMLSKPKITADDKFEDLESTMQGAVTVLVNQSLELHCKGDTEQIEWLAAPYHIPISGNSG